MALVGVGVAIIINQQHIVDVEEETG